MWGSCTQGALALDQIAAAAIVPARWHGGKQCRRCVLGRDPMRTTRFGIGLLSAMLWTLAGCQTPNTTIKPTLHEEYTLPPADDARFSSPPAFPKETLDINQFKKPP